MPGAYAHLMMTEKAFERFRGNQDINEKLRGSVLTHSHFVHLGSVGPDYPFLDIVQPKQKNWAEHMHYRHTGDVIKTMARRLLNLWPQGLEKEEFIIPFCWTLGYLSHVTGDLVIHPVILNIVGSYVGHETEHRHCEMIQDAFIYHLIRQGAEIEHSGLMKILQICSKPGNEDKIHPVLLAFWRDILKTHFPNDYQNNRPDVDQWHDQFEDWIGIAGRPLFVGRIFDPNHKYTYKKTIEITPTERQTFLDRLPLPDGKFGAYEGDVFPKAVEHVTDQWVFLSKGIFIGNIDQFLSGITNADLDTGRDLQTGNLVYWS
jgi:Zinc dependent phospholipase C